MSFYSVANLVRHVNDSIMELLIMCYACKTSSCNKVIGVIPYMPYSRQSEFSCRFHFVYNCPGT